MSRRVDLVSRRQRLWRTDGGEQISFGVSIGVPVESRALKGMDSLLSIVQMPRGVPVATVAIGSAGATNAGLLAAQILAISRPDLRARLETHRAKTASDVVAQATELEQK